MTFSEIYRKADIRRLPIDPKEIAAALGFVVMDYKAAGDFLNTDMKNLCSFCTYGFSFMDDGIFCIAINENACDKRRRRFTAAHEIAHCVLGHTGRKTLSSGDERAAERFAADLLAPLVVLHKCGVRTSGEIARICGISRQAAGIRLEQLAEREKYGFSPSCDEFEVAERFGEYIRYYR